MRPFYQDRLGTNIGKTHFKDRFVQGMDAVPTPTVEVMDVVNCYLSEPPPPAPAPMAWAPGPIHKLDMNPAATAGVAPAGVAEPLPEAGSSAATVYNTTTAVPSDAGLGRMSVEGREAEAFEDGNHGEAKDLAQKGDPIVPPPPPPPAAAAAAV